MASSINASTTAGVVTTADTSGVLNIQTAGTTAVTVDASQNVGVGVTPAAWSLSGLAAVQIKDVSLAGFSNAMYLNNNVYYNGGWKFIGTGYGLQYTADRGAGAFLWNISTASGTAGNAISFTQAMTLDASGNLGIGTTSPTANRRLDAVLNANASTGIRVVNNDAGSATSTNTTYSNGTTTAEFGMLGTGYGSYGVLTAGNGYIYVGSNKALQLSSDGGFIAFGTGTTGAERARIDSSGNLLVGKTSTSATTQGGYISSAGQYVVAQPASTGAVFFQNTSGGATVGTITINASTTTYGTSSDYRLKENIVPMVGALSAVSALKPVTYNWKIDGSDGQGFIAHELAEVCPEAVQGKKDAVDDEGNPVYQGIDTSFLVATLTAAIQEQQALITQLQADVAALKGA